MQSRCHSCVEAAAQVGTGMIVAALFLNYAIPLWFLFRPTIGMWEAGEMMLAFITTQWLRAYTVRRIAEGISER